MRAGSVDSHSVQMRERRSTMKIHEKFPPRSCNSPFASVSFTWTSSLGSRRTGAQFSLFSHQSESSTMSSPKFAAADVSRHNSPDDLWIVLHGKVYDVSKFLKEHPGGEEVLINLAGADATQCFDDIGHSQEAKQLKDTYEIGLLDGTFSSTTTSASTSKGTEPKEMDDDWEYVETKSESSPYIPMFVALGVVVYAVLFYFVVY